MLSEDQVDRLISAFERQTDVVEQIAQAVLAKVGGAPVTPTAPKPDPNAAIRDAIAAVAKALGQVDFARV